MKTKGFVCNMLGYNDYRKTKWNLKKEPLSQLSKQAPDTRFINEDIKRPLKHNHSDLSFKGPFYRKKLPKSIKQNSLKIMQNFLEIRKSLKTDWKMFQIRLRDLFR